MKKILIILTFLFISIFSYSVDIDFNIRVMMGLTKIEEKDNPKYKKFLNTDNADNCIIFKHKNRTKIFDNPEEKEEYIEQFKKIKEHKDIEIEGITSKKLKIEEVVLFDQYSCLIIR